MKLIIDRFEEEFAVCEIKDTSEVLEIQKKLLPCDAKEGDCLNYENNKITIDIEETNNIKNRIKQKMDSLWE